MHFGRKTLARHMVKCVVFYEDKLCLFEEKYSNSGMRM